MSDSSSLLLDTNLLVLFVVGSTDRALIARHKRLRAFTAEDFVGLCGIISHFTRVLITPNILTETSNLLTQIEEPARKRLLDTLAIIIGETHEEYVASRTVSMRTEFSRFGLTDSGILEKAGMVQCILTDDLALYLHLTANGHNAVNFNHCRLSGWSASLGMR